MRALVLAAFAALSLSACTTLSATQQAENADSAALSTYATIGQLLDKYEGVKCGSASCDTAAEGYRAQAAALIEKGHAYYTSGDSAAAATTFQLLDGILKTVKGL